jgi:hypothetical protein
MPITIIEPATEQALEALGDRQPVPASKTAMAAAILRRAAEAFVATDDPNAWQPAAPATPNANGSAAA